MPAVQPPAAVLVTGASGFIAAWTVRRFLEKGFSVVGTVRSADKGEYLKNLFKEFGDKFSFIVVQDIAKDGAFDEAVKNVDAVAHTASPFHMQGNEVEDYYRPALQGTNGVFESIAKHGPRVKRVVVTSSVAAVAPSVPSATDPKPQGYGYTEADWNDDDTKIVSEQGNNAPAVAMYCGSKVVAERAAWDFVERNKSTVSFDVVTIQPPFVFGPTIHQVSSLSSLNTSVAIFRSYVLDQKTAESATEDALTTVSANWVDVRDVADAHVEVILRDSAGGERFITSAGAFAYQDFLNALSTTELKDRTNKGFPGVPSKPTNPTYFDGSKATRELGIKYLDVKTSGLDTAKSLLERFQ